MAPPSGAARGDGSSGGRPESGEDWDEARLLAKYQKYFAFYTRAMGEVMDREKIAKMAMERAEGELHAVQAIGGLTN